MWNNKKGVSFLSNLQTYYLFKLIQYGVIVPGTHVRNGDTNARMKHCWGSVYNTSRNYTRIQGYAESEVCNHREL